MSEIAQALAKAKECRSNSPASRHASDPFPPTLVSAGIPEAGKTPYGKPADTRRIWLVLACVLLPLTAFVLWSRLDDLLPLFAKDEPDLSPAAYGAPAASSRPASSPATASTTAERDLSGVVAALPVSAVIPGEPPRIMLNGRVVRAGEVVEGDLVFSGIADGQIHFTDGQGRVHSRRY